MNGSWQDRSLLDLLHGFGLDLLPEHEFPTDGWSGATFTTVADSEGRRYVLKRTSLRLDWIARATRDERSDDRDCEQRSCRQTHVHITV